MEKIIEKIREVKQHAKENFVPIVRDQTLEKLIDICKNLQKGKVLEIGTATGYSGLNILTTQGLTLTTIEKNKERFQEARQNFIDANVESRVNQILGDAEEVLKNLDEKAEKFDLIFLDGPKGQYLRYLPIIKNLLAEKGILFADNILLGGLIYDESRVNHKNRTMVRNMKGFLEQIKCDNCFSCEIYEIEDGFAICKKI